MDYTVQNAERKPVAVARPREFDVEDVLEKTMRVFWTQGYQSASVDDICDAGEINRSTLYASFGDKRALLRGALTRYVERGAADLARSLGPPVPFRQALSRLLSKHIDGCVADSEPSGCLLGNCAAELAKHDPGLTRVVREGLRRIEAVFFQALEAARTAGEFAQSADITAMARYFVSAFQGLHLIGKINPDRKCLEDIAATMLRVLD